VQADSLFPGEQVDPADDRVHASLQLSRYEHVLVGVLAVVSELFLGLFLKDFVLEYVISHSPLVALVLFERGSDFLFLVE